MSRLLRIDGRLAWPLVVCVLFVSLLLLGVDAAWRILVVPAEVLFAFAAIAGLVGAALFAIYLLVRRRNRPT